MLSLLRTLARSGKKSFLPKVVQTAKTSSTLKATKRVDPIANIFQKFTKSSTLQSTDFFSKLSSIDIKTLKPTLSKSTDLTPIQLLNHLSQLLSTEIESNKAVLNGVMEKIALYQRQAKQSQGLATGSSVDTFGLHPTPRSAAPGGRGPGSNNTMGLLKLILLIWSSVPPSFRRNTVFVLLIGGFLLYCLCGLIFDTPLTFLIFVGLIYFFMIRPSRMKGPFGGPFGKSGPDRNPFGPFSSRTMNNPQGRGQPETFSSFGDFIRHRMDPSSSSSTSTSGEQPFDVNSAFDAFGAAHSKLNNFSKYSRGKRLAQSFAEACSEELASHPDFIEMVNNYPEISKSDVRKGLVFDGFILPGDKESDNIEGNRRFHQTVDDALDPEMRSAEYDAVVLMKLGQAGTLHMYVKFLRPLDDISGVEITKMSNASRAELVELIFASFHLPGKRIVIADNTPFNQTSPFGDKYVPPGTISEAQFEKPEK